MYGAYTYEQIILIYNYSEYPTRYMSLYYNLVI